MTDTPEDLRGGGRAGGRPEVDALTTDFGAAIDAFNSSLDSGADPDLATEDFINRVSALEAIHNDSLGVFANSRRLVAQQLVLRGRVDKAAAVVATIATAEEICFAASQLQMIAFPALGIEVAAQIEDKIMAILDATAPEKALGFLRHTRRLMLEAVSPDTDELLAVVDEEMARRLGDSYEPIADWAAAEAERYPHADWPGLVAIVRDDSLWAEDTPRSSRLFLVLDVARSVDYLLSSTQSAVKDFNKLLKSFMKNSAASFGDIPAKGYLDGIMAVAFYRRGMQNEARAIIKAIQNSGALGFVAESLLRLDPPAVTDAQRLALGAKDGRVTINVILDGQWPDRATPDHLLDEIIVVGTKRTNNGKGPVASQHPIEMRIECLLALAERRESEGAAADAIEYRRRAEQLKWQQERGIVKHMPRKT